MAAGWDGAFAEAWALDGAVREALAGAWLWAHGVPLEGVPSGALHSRSHVKCSSSPVKDPLESMPG